MLIISDHIHLAPEEIELQPIRASGAGGQNVNKVASAIHLRFDIRASSLPIIDKEKLLKFSDQRISGAGIIIIKAQNYRTQEQNRADALERLRELILQATAVRKKRKATRPGRASIRKRLASKKKRGIIKAGRGKVNF